MRRVLLLLAVLVVALGGCTTGSQVHPGDSEGPDGDVFVDFYGSALAVSGSGGGPVATARLSWHEYYTVGVLMGNSVNVGSQQDLLTGAGTGTLTNYLGTCNAIYVEPLSTREHPRGPQVTNPKTEGGTTLEVTAVAPWDIYNVVGQAGPACGQNANSDPTDRSLSLLNVVSSQVSIGNDFKCALAPNQYCQKRETLPSTNAGGVTYTANVYFRADRAPASKPLQIHMPMGFLPEIPLLFLPFQPSFEQLVPLSPSIPPPPNVTIKIPTIIPTEDGDATVIVSMNGQTLATGHGTLHKGTPAQLSFQVDQAVAAAAQAVTAPTLVTATVTFTPTAGTPSTALAVGYLPQTSAGGPTAANAATITSVAFHGSASNPAIVVTGQNLGSLPPANPAGHPSGLGGCPTVSGDQGYDYGNSLYITIPAGNWSAGRSNPSIGETDCFDLVVSKFTSTEVDFSLGGLYSQQTKNQLSAGTAYQLAVNGAAYNGTVSYS